MGKVLEGLARMIAPGLMNEAQVKDLVKEEVLQARQAMPISVDYDPKGEGYRRLAGGTEEQVRRDLSPMSQDLMLELAYYLYDTSGLTKRFVRDTKNFVFGEGVTYAVSNDTKDGAAKAILDKFWNDPMNQVALRLPKRIEFLGLLGEQCWPVSVNPHNGHVWLSYIDPANISDVFTVPGFPEVPGEVKLKGSGFRAGRRLKAIRPEINPRAYGYERMMGDCFFFAVNNPPNGPRGRSDLIHLFDFINGFEEGLFDELDRLKLIKSFIWDVLLEGANDEEIKEFLRHNKTPQAGSVRAHNERVKWEAVAPDLKMSDNKAFFDLMKTYMAACTNRPDSWLGGGGKAYQTEADLMGEPTFKDLGDRQRFVKYSMESVLTFVLDQAVLARALTEQKGERFHVSVSMPEMSTKDLKKIVDGLFTLAQSLMIAMNTGILSKGKAAEMYAAVATQTGVEIDAANEIKEAAKANPDIGTEDYAAREAFVARLTEEVRAKMAEAA